MVITAIMGSPHKGKGYKIIQSIESELKQKGLIDFHYIFLSDIDLKLCKGCFSCFRNGEQTCPLKDDKDKLEELLLNSDGIILSSPGYVLNVSALMKNFIERYAYSLHRPKFFNQKILLVANGGSGVNKVLKVLSTALGGSTIVGKFGIITTPWEGTKKYNEKIQKEEKKYADKLYEAILKSGDKPISLGNFIWFNIFKKMSAISKETLPKDYEYYRNKTNYFYDIKVNRIKSGIAKVIANIGISAMKQKIVFH